MERVSGSGVFFLPGCFFPSLKRLAGPASGALFRLRRIFPALPVRLSCPGALSSPTDPLFFLRRLIYTTTARARTTRTMQPPSGASFLPRHVFLAPARLSGSGPRPACLVAVENPRRRGLRPVFRSALRRRRHKHSRIAAPHPASRCATQLQKRTIFPMGDGARNREKEKAGHCLPCLRCRPDGRRDGRWVYALVFLLRKATPTAPRPKSSMDAGSGAGVYSI